MFEVILVMRRVWVTGYKESLMTTCGGIEKGETGA